MLYTGSANRQYDAGEHAVGETYTQVQFEEEIPQVLFYPTVDSFIKLNGSTKEIFIPALTWTPISVLCKDFSVKGSKAGKIYWQGWFM